MISVKRLFIASIFFSFILSACAVQQLTTIHRPDPYNTKQMTVETAENILSNYNIAINATDAGFSFNSVGGRRFVSYSEAQPELLIGNVIMHIGIKENVRVIHNSMYFRRDRMEEAKRLVDALYVIKQAALSGTRGRLSDTASRDTRREREFISKKEAVREREQLLKTKAAMREQPAPQIIDNQETKPSEPDIEISTPVDTKSLRPDTFAVVIGIDYKGRRDIPALQYASADAKKIHRILTDPKYGGVPKENTILLLNEKATRNEMAAALRKIKTWDGYVYIYYSGHGAPKSKDEKLVDGFLVPYDAIVTDPESMEDSSIKISYLQELVDSTNAKGVMVALDACFSGGGKSIVPKGGKPLVGMLATAELIKPMGAGKVVMTSSALNQQSWEDESELKGGIFSHYLMEGMRGKLSKEVWIKVNDLADYVKENVSKAARRLKNVEQTPQISGSGDFSVTRNWDRAKVMDIEIGRTKLKDAFENGTITAEQLSKAMDEMKSSKKSKTLEAYLEGKIDEKKFGELY
ncbi:MAG: caspase family protein [Nitrospirae bacterium]|nr:caspase family protein [Nitrospirota bacterium]